MIAQTSGTESKAHYLKEAHFFRRAGLPEAALMEAAMAC
jgi:hypothetical protein